jgi:tetratricopeptide (TPR) repeat protein
MPKKVRTYWLLLFSAFLVLILIATTVTRNSVFRDKVSFWADATDKSPGKQRTHHNYGCALAEAEQHAAALHEFRKTLAMKPDGSVLLGYLLIEMGNSYYKLEEYDHAISIWQEALRREPDSAELLNNLAMGFLKKKRYADARKYAERALDIDPSMADTLSTLGQIHLAMGNSEAAIYWSLLALEKKLDVVSLYWDAIEVLEKIGCYALAGEYARRVALLAQDAPSRQRAHKYMKYIKELQSGFRYLEKPVCSAGENRGND